MGPNVHGQSTELVAEALSRALGTSGVRRRLPAELLCIHAVGLPADGLAAAGHGGHDWRARRNFSRKGVFRIHARVLSVARSHGFRSRCR